MNKKYVLIYIFSFYIFHSNTTFASLVCGDILFFNENQEYSFCKESIPGLSLTNQFENIRKGLENLGNIVDDNVTRPTVEVTSQAGKNVVRTVERVPHVIQSLTGFDTSINFNVLSGAFTFQELVAASDLKPFPRWFVNIVKPYYPKIRWEFLRYADNVSFIGSFGYAQALCDRIYFPRPQNMADREDLDTIVHELFHVEQCESSGGIVPFLARYAGDGLSAAVKSVFTFINKSTGDNISAGFFNAHGDLELEKEARDSASNIIGDVDSKIDEYFATNNLNDPDPFLGEYHSPNHKEYYLASESGSACFYNDLNEPMPYQCLQSGVYTNLSNNPDISYLKINQISQIKISGNYEVKVCDQENFNGKCKIFTSNSNEVKIIDLKSLSYDDGTSINNTIDSVLIFNDSWIANEFINKLSKKPSRLDMKYMKEQLAGNQILSPDKARKKKMRRLNIYLN